MNADGSTTLADAFPTLRQASFRSKAGELDPAILTVKQTAARDDFPRIVRQIADALIHQEHALLHEMLPGLTRNAHLPVPFDQLPARFKNRFSELSWATWGELGTQSVSGLLDEAGIGRNSVLGLLELAVKQSAIAYIRSSTDANSSPPSRLDESKFLFPESDTQSVARYVLSSDFVRDLRQVHKWLWATAPDLTLGAVLNDPPTYCPTEIIEAADRLAQSSADKIFPNRKAFDSKQAIESLWQELEDRNQAIFQSRTSIIAGATLEQLGERYDLTRERVRQLQVASEARLRKELNSENYRPLQWIAGRLRTIFGVGWPVGKHAQNYEIVRHITAFPEISDDDADLLIWIAGPYTKSGNWVTAGILPDKSAIWHLVGEAGRVNLNEIREALSDAGLSTKWHHAWLSEFLPTRRVVDCDIVWPRSIVDALAHVLDVLDEPSTVKTMLKACGENINIRSTRARLLEDPRFARVDKHRLALTEWGIAEYGSLTINIAREIEHQGGDADVDSLVQTLRSKFHARPESVRYYLAAPLFVLDGSRVRLRDNEPFVVPNNPGRLKVYRVDRDIMDWKITVDRGFMRGSGRPLSTDVAGWMGLQPGKTLELQGEYDTVRFGWPVTAVQPTISSIRPELLGNSMNIDDEVYVRFNRKEKTMKIISIVIDG